MRTSAGPRAGSVSNFILVSFGVGLIYWFVDCAIDVFIYYEGNATLAALTHGNFASRLLARLSSPDTNEVWMRLLLLLTFVIFGVFVQQTVYRRLSAEQKLKELNQDLELRVQDRTAQLETANTELQAFNYTVSHDLRTPLRAIQQVSGTILANHARALDAGGQERLAAIQSQAEKMSRLIDDLLAFSRSARKEIQLTEIDMSELAQVVFEELKVVEPTRKVTLEVKSMPRAWGDTSMLWEAMCNLLSNAMKFTRTREVARIEVGGWAESGKAQHVFYVKDNGIGFDPQQAARLFGVFQRLHSDTEFEGTGVGLAIVQRIIGRHGGRVWAEGQVDQGATFYLSLPAYRREKTARLPAVTRVPS